MVSHTDKTIPYRLSPAELENFRILRRRIKLGNSNQDEEEEKTPEKIDAENSDDEHLNQDERNKP